MRLGLLQGVSLGLHATPQGPACPLRTPLSNPALRPCFSSAAAAPPFLPGLLSSLLPCHEPSRHNSSASYAGRKSTSQGDATGRGEKQSMRVAVIGAGASGLVAARELVAEGHHVKVFEAAHALGGIWAYDPQTESDPLGSDRRRSKVHSSMYASLRTNLPREVMSYLDLPFVPESMGGRSVDSRRFCTHEEVLGYLEAYADRFDLRKLLRLGRTVTKAVPIGQTEGTATSQEGGCAGWEVVHQGKGDPRPTGIAEAFDALVVATGHYSQPNLPDPPVPGSESWPGSQMHSHNYRSPGGFEGQVVVVVGAQSSGEDISREIAGVAKEVFVCARNWKNPEVATDPKPFGENANMWRRHNLSSLNADGSVEFEDGQRVPRVDIVLYCTGYRYDFPFLEDDGVVSYGNNRVEPLYEHVFSTKVAPRLAFIGLPFNVVAFHLFQMQAKWVARVLAGRCLLSPKMNEETEEMYRRADDLYSRPRYVHEMRHLQWDYLDRLADYCGDVPRLPAWRKEMYLANSNNKRSNPGRYRDVQHDDELQARAADEFRLILEEAEDVAVI